MIGQTNSAKNRPLSVNQTSSAGYVSDISVDSTNETQLNVTRTALPTIPTNVSQLNNDSGYITSTGSCNYANSAGSAGSCTGNAATATNADTVDNFHGVYLVFNMGTSINGSGTYSRLNSQNGDLKICAGSVYRDGEQDRTNIGFGAVFTKPPIVILSPTTSSGSAPSNAWNVVESSLTTTGCTVNCDAGSGTIEDWMFIAIGY